MPAPRWPGTCEGHHTVVANLEPNMVEEFAL